MAKMQQNKKQYVNPKYFLTPSEKGKKFSRELKNKKRYTNLYEVKQDFLTCCEASYRIGYLAARTDGANCYKAQQRKKNK